MVLMIRLSDQLPRSLRQTHSLSIRQLSAIPSQQTQPSTPPSQLLTPSPPLLNMIALGTLTGSLAPLIGLGGGFLIIPALTSDRIMGISRPGQPCNGRRVLTQHESQATSLAIICSASIAGGGGYLLSANAEDEKEEIERLKRMDLSQRVTRRVTRRVSRIILPASSPTNVVSSLSSSTANGNDKEKEGDNSEQRIPLVRRLTTLLTTPPTSKSTLLLTDAMSISLGALLTTTVGLRIGKGMSSESLKKALGYFMICVGPMVPMRGYFEEFFEKNKLIREELKVQAILVPVPASLSPFPSSTFQALPFEIPDEVPRPLKMASLGLVTGFLSGLFGVGGGALTVPSLAFMGPPKTDHNSTTALRREQDDIEEYSYKDILATSLLCMSPPALLATVTSRSIISWRIAGVISAASSIGAFSMASVVGNLDPGQKKDAEEIMRWGFCVLMVGLGGRSTGVWRGVGRIIRRGK